MTWSDVFEYETTTNTIKRITESKQTKRYSHRISARPTMTRYLCVFGSKTGWFFECLLTHNDSLHCISCHYIIPETIILITTHGCPLFSVNVFEIHIQIDIRRAIIRRQQLCIDWVTKFNTKSIQRRLLYVETSASELIWSIHTLYQIGKYTVKISLLSVNFFRRIFFFEYKIMCNSE